MRGSKMYERFCKLSILYEGPQIPFLSKSVQRFSFQSLEFISGGPKDEFVVCYWPLEISDETKIPFYHG